MYLQIFPAPGVDLQPTQSGELLIPAVAAEPEVVENEEELRFTPPDDGHLSGRTSFKEVRRFEQVYNGMCCTMQ